MSHRASDDTPRLILQQLANGKTMSEAEEIVGHSCKNLNRRRRRQGYRTTYEMLADYVAQGLVLVDRKPAF